MRLTGFELRRVAMPLVAPFRTSFGIEHERDVLLVRAATGGAEGWGECVAMSAPLYSACLLYTSPSPRDRQKSRMPSSA